MPTGSRTRSVGTVAGSPAASSKAWSCTAKKSKYLKTPRRPRFVTIERSSSHRRPGSVARRSMALDAKKSTRVEMTIRERNLQSQAA